MHLHRRATDLYIYAPPELAEIISLQLKVSGTVLNYKIHFKILEPEKESACILDNEVVSVKTIPLIHRVPCYGFLFREKPKPRRIIKEKIRKEFTMSNMLSLKKGEHIKDKKGNILFKNEDYTLAPRKSRSYAYCTDTLYHEPVIDIIKGVDLLYHEATFLNEKLNRATETFHTTAKQAATIAKKAKVGQLIIGHFSSRYRDITPFKNEARQVFENTILAIEGESTYIDDWKIKPGWINNQN